MITIILDKPVVKPLNIGGDSRKRFLIVLRYSFRVSSNDGSDDNIFVDIKSVANGVF